MEVCEQEITEIADFVYGDAPEKSVPLPVPTPVHSELLVMDWSTNSHIRFDRNNPQQVAAARARFDELRGQGYLAYKLDASATQGEVVSTFDPNTERTVLHARMVGG